MDVALTPGKTRLRRHFQPSVAPLKGRNRQTGSVAAPVDVIVISSDDEDSQPPRVTQLKKRAAKTSDSPLHLDTPRPAKKRRPSKTLKEPDAEVSSEDDKDREIAKLKAELKAKENVSGIFTASLIQRLIEVW